MKTEDEKMSKWGWLAVVLVTAVALMILAKAASAANVAAGSALNKQSTNTGTNGLGLQLVVGSDFTGNTGSGITVNCTNCGGSGGQAITVSLSSSVPLTTTSSIVSNTSSYAGLTLIAYPLSATTPTVVNVTIAAGVNAPCLVCVGSNGGAAAGFKMGFLPSSTVPNWIYQGLGHYVAASTTSQCWGPFQAGTNWIGLGSGGASSAFVEYQQAK